MDKRESWFTLASGKKFYPFDPRPEDIDIDDIALSLSHLCRFNGHCHEFYSVAEHSVHCSFHVAPGFELAALMHDATEAYVGDLIRPIKRFIPEFEEMEEAVWRAIALKFDLPPTLPPEVKDVDNVMLVTEARDLLFDGDQRMKEWGLPQRPLTDLYILREDVRIPWTPSEACHRFLHRFSELSHPAHTPLTGGYRHLGAGYWGGSWWQGGNPADGSK